MIRLISAHVSNAGKPMLLNPKYIVAVFTEFEGETRISTTDGAEHIVEETVDAIATALASAPADGNST